MAKFGYESSIDDFKENDLNFILGEITKNFEFYELNELQRNAWKSQIKILKNQLSEFSKGNIIFEYKIPRMGSIIDNVLLLNGLVFIIEFKVGEEEYVKGDMDQLNNYIDILKNYHYESKDKTLVPILVSTEAEDEEKDHYEKNGDKVLEMIKANKNNLSNIIFKICEEYNTNDDLTNWSKSRYVPSPTILEAARELYESHEVGEINTSSAFKGDFDDTEKTINEIIKDSKESNKKSIIFLTGVPGAGKTLVGLNIAAQRSVGDSDPAVFLSGNGPLVRVLQEALSRDSSQRKNISKREAKLKVISFIQPIHQFRDEAISDELPPHENIVIFDEAQRAWTKRETEKFMEKRGIPNFDMSEPEFLISIMDRKEDWAVIICLVGQGQEINRGEAGISEWFRALENRYPHWNVYASKKDLKLNEEFNDLKINYDNNLYLDKGKRALDAPNLPKFVEFLLDNDKDNSIRNLNELDYFPLFITRNLNDAKKWIKNVSSEKDRYGLLAQSNGIRLIPAGIFVKNNIDVEAWFLNDADDIRSSNHLEIAATEFDIQGLEIDYSIVGWDGNLRYVDGDFQYYKFKGTKWNKIRDDNLTEKNYLINSYRVLLTRARSGMVIFVPEGDNEDKTRLKEYYDGTYEYLKSLGIKELEL